MTATNAITLDDVRVSFGSLHAVDGVSATIERGTFTSIIGPNGCGKSTLLRVISQVHPADSGTVTVLGHDVAHANRRQLAQQVSLLPQVTTAPPGLTVAELVARGRHPYHSLLRTSAPGDAAAIASAVDRAQIGHLLDRPVAQLSGGQRQRVWLGMVLAQDTEVVLLDEPTTYLDLAAQYHLLDLCADLVDEGRTVVAVLHDLPQAVSYSDHLLLMQAGRLVASGTPREVITEQRVLDVYGIACHIDLDGQDSPVVAPLPRSARRTR